MEHLNFLGYEITIYPKNHEGYILAKAEHPYKDILIKRQFLWHTRRYIIRSIKDDIRYMEKIKD